MLQDIQTVPKCFDEEKLKYHMSNIHWCHVGWLVVQDDGNARTECILYNVADLEQVSSEEKGCVERHIKSLRE